MFSICPHLGGGVTLARFDWGEGTPARGAPTRGTPGQVRMGGGGGYTPARGYLPRVPPSQVRMGWYPSHWVAT